MGSGWSSRPLGGGSHCPVSCLGLLMLHVLSLMHLMKDFCYSPQMVMGVVGDVCTSQCVGGLLVYTMKLVVSSFLADQDIKEGEIVVLLFTVNWILHGVLFVEVLVE